MLTSDRQTRRDGLWQIKTKEGMYYQPESLVVLYQWIFENRLCADDFIFSSRQNDWIPIINMPELKSCFWQLLTSGDVIYGPVSLGELKQLYINSQITSGNKVTILGREDWVQIKEIPALNEWLMSLETPIIDYIQFVDRLEKEFESWKDLQKEEKISRKQQIIEQQNKENIRFIKELETAKGQLEEELANRTKQLEEVLRGKDELGNRLQSARDELETLQSGLKEKIALIEELNKHIAQSEVTGTLKDDEIGQLRSSITSLQEELERSREEKVRLQQSLPQTVRDLEGIIDELKKTISQKDEEISGYKQDIDRFQHEIIDKDRIIEEAGSGIGDIESITRSREEEINNMQELISKKEAEIIGYRDSIARLQGELAERDRELAGTRELEAHIEELTSEISGYKQRIEDLSKVIEDKGREEQNLINEIGEINEQHKEHLRAESEKLQTEVKIREDTISELKHNLDSLRQEYSAKLKEWEEAVTIQKTRFNNELAERTRLWDETFGTEKEKWEKTKQDLEGSLAQKDAQIENQKLEIERLQNVLISYDKQWKDRVEAVHEEADRLYKELEKQRDTLCIELTQRINELVTERDAQQIRLIDIERVYEELIQRRDALQKELLDREKFIESIKTEAHRQEELYRNQLQDMEQRLSQANGDIEGLQNKVEELNKGLNSVKQMAERLEQEKEVLILEKEEFTRIKSQLEHDLEELKRNLEHTEEENRSIQKQFYLEKQKLTKEYTETINRLEKLQKRGQLEKEIQDRTKMKDELERLFILLKENFEGIQRGATEIQSTLQNLNEDIDNKRLSLKYLTETEKRGEKKNQFSKTEQVEEPGISS